MHLPEEEEVIRIGIPHARDTKRAKEYLFPPSTNSQK